MMHNPAKTILIVSASSDVFEVIRHVFISKDASILILQADSLASAIRKNNETALNAVISEYYLNDGIATDLLPLLKTIPLIVLFEEGNEDKYLPVLHAGAFTYLIKDKGTLFAELLFIIINRTTEKAILMDELIGYRAQLERIIEERTIKINEMYGKLKENEANFRNIFQSAGDSMIITDYNMQFIEANEAFYKQFGVTRDYLSSISLMDFLLPEYKNIIFDRLAMLKQGISTGYIELMVRSMRTEKNQSFEVNSVPIVFNQKVAVLSIIRDLTERKLSARRLFETIIQTEEQERSRIARDLHDEIGPLISALKIYTSSFLESSDAERRDEIARQIGKITRDLIDSVKTISNDMSPHVLENFGLLSAISGIINLFSDDIRISFPNNISGLRFPISIESVIFRIFKELINNTVRHAHAKIIDINMHYFESVLLCNYRDDGVGFDLPQMLNSSAKGLGLNNIITRIKSLGGEYEIHTEPGSGFEINFAVITNPESSDAK